jgi:hypothetical protein
LRLVWEPAALQDLEEAAAWSPMQAARVVDAMERMATIGWSLAKPTRRPGVRYWGQCHRWGSSTSLAETSCG